LPDDIAEITALGWEDGNAFADAHFAEMKALLDAEGADYTS